MRVLQKGKKCTYISPGTPTTADAEIDHQHHNHSIKRFNKFQVSLLLSTPKSQKTSLSSDSDSDNTQPQSVLYNIPPPPEKHSRASSTASTYLNNYNNSTSQLITPNEPSTCLPCLFVLPTFLPAQVPHQADLFLLFHRSNSSDVTHRTPPKEPPVRRASGRFIPATTRTAEHGSMTQWPPHRLRLPKLSYRTSPKSLG
ncbi:hypothetical protein ACMFMG_002424 [Clarireedia jacksonii]